MNTHSKPTLTDFPSICDLCGLFPGHGGSITDGASGPGCIPGVKTPALHSATVSRDLGDGYSEGVTVWTCNTDDVLEAIRAALQDAKVPLVRTRNAPSLPDQAYMWFKHMVEAEARLSAVNPPVTAEWSRYAW